MRGSWRDAYFAQARSDFEVYKILSRADGVEMCHRLHYLQMATEKLAKGFLSDPRQNSKPKTVHNAFRRFVQGQAKGNRLLREACRYEGAVDAFRQYLDGLAPIAGEIEQLAPVGRLERRNPEYPWSGRIETPGRVTKFEETIEAPCQHDFEDLDPRGNRMRNIMKFIAACFQAVAAENR